jgi:hypothetical protein
MQSRQAICRGALPSVYSRFAPDSLLLPTLRYTFSNAPQHGMREGESKSRTYPLATLKEAGKAKSLPSRFHFLDRGDQGPKGVCVTFSWKSPLRVG